MAERPTHSLDNLPAALPLFPLPGVLLLPGGQVPLNIFEPRYLNMIEDALGNGRLIGMIQPLAETDQRHVPDDTELFGVGCAGRIVQFSESGDGRYLITLQGVCRFRAGQELPGTRGYRLAQPDFAAYADDLDTAGLAGGQRLDDRPALLAAMTRYFELMDIEADIDEIRDAPDGVLVTSLAMSCPLDPGEKQALLECPDTGARAQLLTSMFEIAIHGDGTAGAGPQ